MRYLVGYLRHFLLVQGLRQFDHLKALLVFASFVKFAYIADMQQFVPSSIFFEYPEAFVLYTLLFQLVRVAATRDAQQDIAVIHLHIKQVDIPRRWHECASVVVYIVAHAIVAAIRVTQGLKEGHFAFVAFAEEADNLFGLSFFRNDRSIFCDDSLHACFELLYYLRRNDFGRIT